MEATLYVLRPKPELLSKAAPPMEPRAWLPPSYFCDRRLEMQRRHRPARKYSKHRRPPQASGLRRVSSVVVSNFLPSQQLAVGGPIVLWMAGMLSGSPKRSRRLRAVTVIRPRAPASIRCYEIGLRWLARQLSQSHTPRKLVPLFALMVYHVFGTLGSVFRGGVIPPPRKRLFLPIYEE